MTHSQKASEVLRLIAYRGDAVNKMVTTVAEIYGDDEHLDEEAYAEKHETLRVLTDVCEETVDKLVEEVVKVYVSHYTPDELDGLIAWYSSALGQKTLDEKHTMFLEITKVVEVWSGGLWKIVRLRRGFVEGGE